MKRNSRAMVENTPARLHMAAAQVLAGLHPTFSPEQAQSWLRDSQQGFDQSLRDPWS